ncbi:tyrosine-protein kinase Dnt-like [Rhopalosiphum maidis]|uniref:tyrosine-protein kinase Dnt-like n=1 Tax=Rhopalosiphum maidis TaxID=43146 RepID=UPI000EFED5CB|nr:tyrosine-protein kinase Dnt-like [Rhopalosiphum maidis]
MGFFTIVLLYCLSSATGHLNVFISQKEVKRIMGLSSELYYVRDGVVNTYAMNFEVPVPANIGELEFCWQSLTRHSLPYTWNVESNNGIALKKPELDIPESGWVPSHVQVFRLKLPCTGVVSSEVHVLLTINITAVNPKHGDISLVFHRNKICLKTTDMLLDSLIGKDGSLETNLINELPPSQQQQPAKSPAQPPLLSTRPQPDNEKSLIMQPSYSGTAGTVQVATAVATTGSGNTALTSPKQGDETPEELVPTHGAFFFALGCGFALIVTLVAVTFALAYKRTNKSLLIRSKSKESLHTSYTSAAYVANPNVLVRVGSVTSTSGTYATIRSLRKTAASMAEDDLPNHCVIGGVAGNKVSSHVSPYATSYVATAAGSNNYHVYSKPASPTASKISYYACTPLMAVNDRRVCDDLDERIRQLDSRGAKVKLERLLQEGAFGRVYQGTYKNNNAGSQEVLVKTVTTDAASQQNKMFLTESLMLHGLPGHVNILQPMAVCQYSNKPTAILYPFSNKGNLKKFLCDCKKKNNDYYNLTTKDIVNMAVQLCLGSVFLHSQGICHKDIATRNCVVDEKLRVKLADSGLSRDLFPDDYSCLNDNENRPIKWMALESITLRTYNGASDIWSFGVLLWELVCLGAQPYSEIDPYDLSLYLQEGYRLSQPINCPDDLFGMMTFCWLPSPEERPSSAQVLACLQDFQKTLNQFI